MRHHTNKPFDNRVSTNSTVILQYGETKIVYNIRRIKPYKSDTKVEDFNSINMFDTVKI